MCLLNVDGMSFMLTGKYLLAAHATVCNWFHFLCLHLFIYGWDNRLRWFLFSTKTRDVKRSSKIRTSNKAFEFGFVFRPFNVCLLTAFYWMPLFVFDHDCMDRSRIWRWWCCDVHSCGCDGTFLLAVAGSHQWCVRDVGDRRWCVSKTWVGTCAMLKPWDNATCCPRTLKAERHIKISNIGDCLVNCAKTAGRSSFLWNRICPLFWLHYVRKMSECP